MGLNHEKANRSLWHLYFIFLIAAFLCYRFCFPPTGVSLLNYYRVEVGMHADEVDALFGGPNEDGFGKQGLPIRVPNQGWIETWRGDPIRITIVYDRDAKVVEKEWAIQTWTDRDWLLPPNWFGVQKIRQ